MKRKLIAVALTVIILLQFSACGKTTDEQEVVTDTVVETAATVDTPETKDTPDTVTSTPTVSKSAEKEDKSHMDNLSKEANKTDSKTISENTNSSTSSAAASSIKSEKTNSQAASSTSSNNQTKATSGISSSVPSSTTNQTAQTTNNNNSTAVSSQNTVTQVTVSEVEQSTPPENPVVSFFESEPELEPSPSEQPVESELEQQEEPQPQVIDSPFAKPYDIEYIRNYMIDYGISRGLILDESMNIANSAWSSPIDTTWYYVNGQNWNSILQKTDTEIFENNCTEDIDSIIKYVSYCEGDYDGLRFNVQIIELTEHPGDYEIYVPYG